MEDKIDSLFERFDFDKGTYTIGGKSYKVKEVSASDFEKIQDMMVEIKDDSDKSPKEIMQQDRKFTKLLLKTVLGLDYEKVKKTISITDLRTMVGEIGGFLVNFGSMNGLKDYIVSLKEKLNESQKNNTTD